MSVTGSSVGQTGRCLCRLWVLEVLEHRVSLESLFRVVLDPKVCTATWCSRCESSQWEVLACWDRCMRIKLVCVQ